MHHVVEHEFLIFEEAGAILAEEDGPMRVVSRIKSLMVERYPSQISNSIVNHASSQVAGVVVFVVVRFRSWLCFNSLFRKGVGWFDGNVCEGPIVADVFV